MKTKKVIVLEDAAIIGGLSTSIKELIVDNQLKDIIIKCYAYPDEFIDHGTNQEIEQMYHLDNDSIIHDIINL